MATLSVLIPNYNHEKLLPRALDSLVNQSRSPDQVVIVDDGSTDGSVALIQSYQRRFPYIELIQHPKNLGVLEAVRTGIERIKSDFLCGLAADDYMMEGWVERCMNMADQYPNVGLIFGKTKIINEKYNKSRIVFFAEEGDEDAYWSPERFRKLLRRSDYFTYISSSSIYRRESLSACGGFRRDLMHYSDTFASNVMGARDGVCYVSHLANVFVQSTGSFSSKQRRMTDIWEKIVHRTSEILGTGEFDDCLSKEDQAIWIRSLIKQTIETPIWHFYFEICQKRDVALEKIENKPLKGVTKGISFGITGLLRILLTIVIAGRWAKIHGKLLFKKFL